MSMLSAQCDELREVAYKVDEYQMGRERVPLKTAAIMREAADTIWQLRDDLQRTNAENAKLRELAKEACETARDFYSCVGTFDDLDYLLREARELGMEVQS